MVKTPKNPTKLAKATAPKDPRQLKKPVYKSFKLQKRIAGAKLPGSVKLLRDSFVVLGRNWKLFLGIVVIYGVLNALLVQGFSAGSNLSNVKSVLDSAVTGSVGHLASGVSLFAYMLSTSGNTVSPTAGAYQVFLALTVSLALIWVLRQVHAGQAVRLRDGFYKGMTPLVTFIFVLFTIGLQLVPLAVGAFLFSTVTSSGIAASSVEQLLWAMLMLVLALLSLYMVSSSLFALYIVTLPNMTPLRALRSARQLVRYRRWTVLRKVLFLPVALIIIAGLIIIPTILFATPAASWAFYAATMLLLPVVHSYMYGLYRALL